MPYNRTRNLALTITRLLALLRHALLDFSLDTSHSALLHLTPSSPAAPWPWPQPFLSPPSVVPGKSRTEPKASAHTQTQKKHTRTWMQTRTHKRQEHPYNVRMQR